MVIKVCVVFSTRTSCPVPKHLSFVSAGTNDLRVVFHRQGCGAHVGTDSDNYLTQNIACVPPQHISVAHTPSTCRPGTRQHPDFHSRDL